MSRCVDPVVRLHLFFYLLVCEPAGLALDLEDYHPSVLLHCWLGHLTCKMTYNVSSGTLNPTIPYHIVVRYVK